MISDFCKRKASHLDIRRLAASLTASAISSLSAPFSTARVIETAPDSSEISAIAWARSGVPSAGAPPTPVIARRTSSSFPSKTVNVYGPLLTTRALAPVIERNGGGAVVNVLTIVALASMPALAGYNASKAASWSLTQSLRGSLAAKGIAVHSVFPGPVDTDMAASIPVQKTSPDDVARAIVEGVAEGREDIFPDPMSASVYQSWRADHKAVERQFAA